MDNIETQFEKKPKKKIGLIITLAIIILIIAAILVGYFVFFKSPKLVFSKAIDKIVNSIESGSYDTAKVKLDMELEIDSNNGDLEDFEDAIEIINNSKLSFETQLDLKNKQEIVNLSLDHKNENVINAQVYYDDGDMYLYFADIFDKYINLELDDDSIGEMLDQIIESQSTNEDTEKAIKIAAKELKKELLKESDFSKDSTTIEIDGEDTNVTKNILKINAKQFSKVIKTVCKNLRGNEKFLKCFKESPKDMLKTMEEQIDLDEVDSKDKLTITIYTKGILNNVVGADIEIYNSEDDETTGLYLIKESKDTYTFEFKYYSDFSINVKKITGKVSIDKEVDKKDEKEGKIKLDLKAPDGETIKLNLGYKVETNKGIDTIKIKNPVKLDEITDKEKEEIIERLYDRPLIGEIISNSMNESIFTKANTAANNTRIAQINEAIALTKADLYADYYDPSNLDESKIYGKTMSGVLTTYQSTEPTKASVIEDRINYYLDSGSIENTIKIKVSYANGIYTVKLADGVIVDFDDKDINSIECNFWK